MQLTDYEGLREHWLFAFPCLETVHQKYPERLNKERLNELVEIYWNNEVPNKEELEKLNPQAVNQMELMANQYGTFWNNILVVDYFWNLGFHNKFIEEEKGTFNKESEASKNFCKVRDGTIEEFIESQFGSRLITNINGVFIPMVQGVGLNLKLGDKVRTHHGYIIKKLNTLEDYHGD